MVTKKRTARQGEAAKERNYYIVSADVPLPSDHADRRRGRWAFLAKMKLRSSFPFPKAEYNKVHAALHYAKKHYGVEFATFKQENGDYRAFRVK